MVWLDCRELGIPSDQLADFWYQKGHVWMHDGTIFGAPGFMRMNIACPKSTVQRALEQMKEAVDEYNSKK
jgi:cystathionine beta-lyase